jgi:tRNA (guanine-N7-)-methyltransferase
VSKNKLFKFAKNETFAHVFQPHFSEVFDKDYRMKGQWRKEFFKNGNPLVLELGCGKGEYTIGLAKRYPNKNFLGMDIKGARLWRGATTIEEEKIPNAGFLRTRIDFINSFYEQGEVDEIWITFPDPQLREAKEKKRLTSRLFMDRYLKVLKPGGIVHLKTDSPELYAFTVGQIKMHGYESLENTDDLYGERIEDLDAETADILKIRTFYESMWLEKGLKIHYLKFKPC